LFFSSYAAKRFGFRLSEFFFTVFGKNLWNRHPEFRSNDLIDIEQSRTHSAAQAPSN
jgi:hypothetical protein